MADEDRRGIYSFDYFSGSQTAIYIGDVWVDEITSISYSVAQNRTPIYGYASQLYDDISKGPVLVQGEFSINFKEAGYLWLILNRYREIIKNQPSKLNPFKNSDEVSRRNIEEIVNNERTTFEKTEILRALSEAQASIEPGADRRADELASEIRGDVASNLGGFASLRPGRAEEVFERFEDRIWGRGKNNTILDAGGASVNVDNRRADDTSLNPFDIYIAYGDFLGDNRSNHTIRKLSNVTVVQTSQQVVIDGQPIQEVYQFLGRDVV